MCLFLLEILLEVEFWDHKEGMYSILVHNIKNFYKVVVPIYTSITMCNLSYPYLFANFDIISLLFL